MDALHQTVSIRLTSAEIAELFTTYLSDSASRCVLSYFSSTVKDPDIYAIVQFSLELSERHLKIIEDIFSTIDHPIPHGFSNEDVNVSANMLFGDTFVLRYLKHMGAMGLSNYTEALSVSAREDVRKFFADCIQSNLELVNRADDALLAKGLYIRPPYIDIPDETEFVKKQSYIHGLLGDTRPLNAQEITQIFINTQTNIIGKAFAMGLSQVAESKKMKNYLLRGKEIAEKHVNIFNDLLKKEDLPYSVPYDAEVFNSTEQIFSDRLIMFHVNALNAYGLALYGNTMAKTMRADIAATFARLSAEVAQYAKDGMDIMLDNEWLEKVPETANRKELVGV